MDAGTRYYLFWKWQYEVRNKEICGHAKTFTDPNYDMTKPMKGILDEIALGIFDPWPPTISNGKYYESSITRIEEKNVRPTFETWNKARLYLSVNINEDDERLFRDFKLAVATCRADSLASQNVAWTGIVQGTKELMEEAFEAKDNAAGELDVHLSGDHIRVWRDGTTRATGLWLWDRLKELEENRRFVKADLIREFTETFDLKVLGLESKVDSDYYLYLTKTASCIEKCEVVSFSAKKKSRSGDKGI